MKDAFVQYKVYLVENMITDEALLLSLAVTLGCKLPQDEDDDIKCQIQITFNSNPSSYIKNN